MPVPDIDGELGHTMCRARVDTDSDSIDCSVDVVGEGAPLVAIAPWHRYPFKQPLNAPEYINTE